MEQEKVVLSLGSNLGQREASLFRAVARMEEVLHSLIISSIYKTSPVDNHPQRHQPYYYNIVLTGHTKLSPSALLQFTQEVEVSVTEQAVADGFPFQEKRDQGPRYLDIDIIFYGEKIVDYPYLSIPHPAYQDRLFVLVPLLEIEPGWRDPINKEKIADRIGVAIENFPEQQVVKIGNLTKMMELDVDPNQLLKS